jgi:sialate O-acetylesterase
MKRKQGRSAAVKLLPGLLVLFLSAGSADADVTLPAIFGDHMILQRGLKVPIWGKAEPGENITVTIDKQSQHAAADQQGKWRVMMGPIAADAPVAIEISGKNSITISDVLIGEVWLCSGQSNMQFAVRSALNAREAIAAADRPTIRFFQVRRARNDAPQEDVGGKWVVCTPRSVRGLSAAAYFFATNLQQKLPTPVGLIEADWGGTRAEAWLPKDAFDNLHLPYEPQWTQAYLHPTAESAAANPPAVPFQTLVTRPRASYKVRVIVPSGIRTFFSLPRPSYSVCVAR